MIEEYNYPKYEENLEYHMKKQVEYYENLKKFLDKRKGCGD